MCSIIDLADIPNELLPGLPDSVVLGNLLHRLPWYSRPVLRAVSKAWCAVLTNSGAVPPIPNATSTLSGLLLIHPIHEFKEKAKSIHNKSLSNTGLSMNTPYEAPLALSMYEEDTKKWRLLPPIQGLAAYHVRLFPASGVASTGGKVYVMGGYDGQNNKVRQDVFMLDIGRGKWVWEKCKRMQFARCQFLCRAYEGKIYVIGGHSAKGEPDPEVYDTEKNEWEVLPRVLRQESIEWAMVTYNGLAIVEGSVIAHGYWQSQTGNVIRFCRRYDRRWRRWKGLYKKMSIYMNRSDFAIYWANWRATCSDVVEGVYDMRDGWLAKFSKNAKGEGKWEALMEGGSRVCERAWCVVLDAEDVLLLKSLEEEEEEEEEICRAAVVRSTGMGGSADERAQLACISISCVQNLVVSQYLHSKVAYITLCKVGDPCVLSLWRGQVDHLNVKWTNLPLPQQAVSLQFFAMCSFEP